MFVTVGVRVFMFTARAPGCTDASRPAYPSSCRPGSAATRRPIDLVMSNPLSPSDSATRNPSVLSDARHAVAVSPGTDTHGPRSGSLSALFVLRGPSDRLFGPTVPLLQKLLTLRNVLIESVVPDLSSMRKKWFNTRFAALSQPAM